MRVCTSLSSRSPLCPWVCARVLPAQWIVLDGDIDAEWIESMNTVMDDNKMLTLASNERIPLTPSMRLLLGELSVRACVHCNEGSKRQACSSAWLACSIAPNLCVCVCVCARLHALSTGMQPG